MRVERLYDCFAVFSGNDRQYGFENVRNGQSCFTKFIDFLLSKLDKFFHFLLVNVISDLLKFLPILFHLDSGLSYKLGNPRCKIKNAFCELCCVFSCKQCVDIIDTFL